MRRIATLSLCCLVVAGCEKTPPKITDRAKVNEWVYEVMEENYLWADHLPAMSGSGLATPTKSYFDEGLRYRDNRGVHYSDDTYGDRFSHIDFVGEGTPASRAADEEQVYDYGFNIVRVMNGAGLAYAQVLYVVEGSPAAGKLRRGDAFARVNGEILTSDNVDRLLAANSVEIEVLNRPATVKMDRGRYWDRPIMTDTIYDNLPRKTAYMLYNHFTDSGPADGDYTGRLRAAFGRYRQAGVRDLILDLRYNGGGEINNARLLASLIAPASALGEVFMYKRNKDDYYEADRLERPAENADIENLYVLTSRNTASASELIIHTLRPFYGDRLHVIGLTTRGKNVGSVTYTNRSYDWEITPMVMMIYDRNKVSGYERGIDPDPGMTLEEYIATQESSPYFYFAPLGDYRNEWLLNYAMHAIYPDDVPEAGFGTLYLSRSGSGPETVVDIPERGLSFGVVEF